MSDRAEDLNEWRSEQYAKNAKSYEPKVWLTVDEAKDILWDLRDLYKQTYGYEWVKNEPWFDEFKKRIENAEVQDEIK